MIDALVLGGGNAKDLAQVEAKGLVPINGRPMVEYVIDALCECDQIGKICVVVPHEYQVKSYGDKVDFIVASGSLPQVTKAGIDHLKADKNILILSADIPLISPEAIKDFLDRCNSRCADFYYPIVRFGESEKRFPEVKRTYAKVKEGRFTGGNIALVNPDFIKKNLSLMEKVYEVRKQPVKIAKILGFSFLIKFIFGMLSIKQIEERVGEITNSVCAGVITPYVEIGIDVDKQSDLQLAIKAIAGGIT